MFGKNQEPFSKKIKRHVRANFRRAQTFGLSPACRELHFSNIRCSTVSSRALRRPQKQTYA